ncbi:MAG: hypothetical protein QOJ91_1365 [Sphingomonadales bacterium]|nr:hypothetical protein [Sphingomonadales bacterium]
MGAARGAVLNPLVVGLSWLALLAPAAVAAQDIPPVSYPSLPAEAAAERGFVPAGWRIEARASGDLDGDGQADSALVLRETDPRNIIPQPMCEEKFDTNPRILAVLLAQPGGGYRRVAQNHELIPRRDDACQVDPFSEIAIERGALRIEFERMMSAGGWDSGRTAFQWRWRDGALRLIGFDYSNVQRNSGAMGLLSINYPTGRVKISTGNIEKDREKVRWKALRNRRAPTIDEVGDGLMFDPEGLVGNLP